MWLAVRSSELMSGWLKCPRRTGACDCEAACSCVQKVLEMGEGNAKQKYRVGGEWIESSPEGMDFGVLADKNHRLVGMWKGALWVM